MTISRFNYQTTETGRLEVVTLQYTSPMIKCMISFFIFFCLPSTRSTGTIPRGDTGGGQSLACKPSTAHQLGIPCLPPVKTLCWVGIREGSSVRWINSLFVQILWIWLFDNKKCLTQLHCIAIFQQVNFSLRLEN